MKGCAEKCVVRHCELVHKSVDQLSNVSTPCMDDHQCTTDDFEIVGPMYVPKLFVKCEYLTRFV